MVFELKLRSQSYHLGSIGYRFGDLQHWSIFKKYLTLTHRHKICMAPIMTNDSILDASKYSPNKTQQIPSKLNNVEAFMDRKPEKVKYFIFLEFWPIFRYFSDTPPKFQLHFCSNWYIYMYSLIVLWKRSFSTIYKGLNFGHKIRLNNSKYSVALKYSVLNIF